MWCSRILCLCCLFFISHTYLRDVTWLYSWFSLFPSHSGEAMKYNYLPIIFCPLAAHDWWSIMSNCNALFSAYTMTTKLSTWATMMMMTMKMMINPLLCNEPQWKTEKLTNSSPYKLQLWLSLCISLMSFNYKAKYMLPSNTCDSNCSTLQTTDILPCPMSNIQTSYPVTSEKLILPKTFCSLSKHDIGH